jgi:MmgE/PrpD N-terminal domain
MAGKGARPVETITRFAASMGPAGGSANPAASHVDEQGDAHNGSVFHPATVVFPVALAMAQTLGASGQRLLTAAVAGYEVGIRVGEFLGRSHYKVFHTTGTAGTLAAAAAAGADCHANAARLWLCRYAVRQLAAFSQAATPVEMVRDIDSLWAIADCKKVGQLLKPAPMLEQLNAARRASMQDPVIKQRLAQLSSDMPPMDKISSSGLKTHLEAEINKSGQVIKKAGIYADRAGAPDR